MLLLVLAPVHSSHFQTVNMLNNLFFFLGGSSIILASMLVKSSNRIAQLASREQPVLTAPWYQGYGSRCELAPAPGTTVAKILCSIIPSDEEAPHISSVAATS